MSFTRVDLPDPDTPVTAVNTPSGNSTVRSFRLCSRAPFTTRHSLPGGRRLAGTGMERLPDRYCPVIDALFLRSCLTVPRSEEHTSELQSLMRNSYAVFCLKKQPYAHQL